MATSTDLRSAIEEVQGQLPAEQLPAGGELPLGEGSWAGRLERRVGALPWWVISAATHAVLFLLIALLATAVAPPKSDEVIISTDVVRQKPPEYDPTKQRDIFKNPKEVQAESLVENPVVTHEKMDQAENFQTDNNMDKNTSRGTEDAISDIPLGGTGTVGSIGVGGGGMAGVFGYRDGGGRKKAVGRFGGSVATESSVEAALRWLARHQEKDGHWANEKFNEDKVNTNSAGNEGITGLATLAFLGAGYTHKAGQFADNVKRATEWLAKQQRADGRISKADGGNDPPYNHAIATLALAEAYGMTQDPALRESAQKAVDCVLAWQNPYSGWRYTPKAGDNDASVSGWMIMALKSAKIGGLKTDGAGFQGAVKYLDSVTDERTGHVGYGGKNRGRWQSMTSVCMLCKLLMGFDRSEAMLQKQGELLLTDPPDWKKMASRDEGHSMYYWYYGTLAVFQLGGDRWTKWNEAMKKALLPNQCKGGPMDGTLADKDGSWDPVDWLQAYSGTRVYATAINALSLEVYYRYLPMYTK
jgi:hypothetical protein